jgi:hypothetical protein
MPTKTNAIPLGTRTKRYTDDDTSGNNTRRIVNGGTHIQTNANNDKYKRKRNYQEQHYDDNNNNRNNNRSKRQRQSRSRSRYNNDSYNRRSYDNRRYRSNSRSQSPPKRRIRDKFTFDRPPPIEPYMNNRIRNARTVMLTNIDSNVGSSDIQSFFENYNYLVGLNKDIVGAGNNESNGENGNSKNDDVDNTNNKLLEAADTNSPKQVKMTDGQPQNNNKQQLPPLKVYDIAILLHPRLQQKRNSHDQQYATYSNSRQSKCIAYVEFDAINMASIAILRYHSKPFIYGYV